MIHKIKQVVLRENRRVIIPCRIADSDSDDKLWVECNALIDTGAQISCISTEVVQKLSLSPFYQERITFALGSAKVWVHLVDIEIMQSIKIKGMVVANFSVPGIDVIIGMDILALGEISMKGKGKELLFTFSVSDRMLRTLDYLNFGLIDKMLDK